MLYVYEVSNHALLAASFQALIQDFVREGGWLAPKIFQGAQRRKTFLGLFEGGLGACFPRKIDKYCTCIIPSTEFP